MSLDWSNERYVRLYTRDTATWKLVDWRARTVLLHLLRKVDRAGVLDVSDDGTLGLAAVLELPLEEVVEPGIAQLIKRGVVVSTGSAYVLPNFLAAQEAAASDAQRQRDARDRRRAAALSGRSLRDETSRNVTDESRSVTERHELSHGVTTCHSEPSLADPIRAGGIPPNACAREEDPGQGPPSPPTVDRSRDAWRELAEQLHAQWTAAGRALTDELRLTARVGGAMPTPEDHRRIMAVVGAWSRAASLDDRELVDLAAERMAHLVAVRSAESRAKRSVQWWAGPSFWSLDGIERDLARTVQDASRKPPGRGPPGSGSPPPARTRPLRDL